MAPKMPRTPKNTMTYKVVDNQIQIDTYNFHTHNISPKFITHDFQNQAK